LKFGTDIEDGPSLRTDHKTIPKWAWPGSRDLISKFWDPLVTLKEKSNPLEISYGEWRTDPFCVGTIKRKLHAY